jgi:hypothetical protein
VPFNYMEGDCKPKILPPDRSFSLFSWNICGLPGFAITSGGVLPCDYRIDAIIEKIVQNDADINCLCEVFDIKSAIYICMNIKQKGYIHFYFNMGPRRLGVSAGLLVASKYNIQSPEFSPFPQNSLFGISKYASKGVFAFDLESQGEHFARIFSTHLQHSEEATFPRVEEVEARQTQMRIIIDKIQAIREKCLVAITGDLNIDDTEYRQSSWQALFQKGDQLALHTWGGNAFCAQLTGRRVSGPRNLDHTMVLRGTAHSIQTSLVEAGFDPAVFKGSALSDHNGLFSRITLM